jgi:hypothetical protein
MKSVICGGYQHLSVDACAAYLGIPAHTVEEAIYITGKLEGMPIRFGGHMPDLSGPKVVHGAPLLGEGYCTHRLGAYLGGRY